MKRIKLRKLRKSIGKNKVKILVVALIVLVLIISTGYAILNTNLNINGSATIGKEETCDLNVSGDLTINTSWGGGDGTTVYNATLTVKNNSNEDIVGWTIKIKGPSDLIVQTNADITVDDNGVITLTNLSWNGMINVDNSLQLDLGIRTVETELNIEYITFNGCKVYGTGAVIPDEPDDPDPTIELTNLELSPSEYTMTIGETVTLQTIKTPSNAGADLSYSSSDESVATVSSNGTVTALKEGTTTITVSSGSISATSTIIVESTKIPSTDEVEVKFAQSAYWGDISNGYAMNFSITITNNSENTINSVKFNLGLPDNSTYSVWTNGASVTNNDFTYSSELASSSNVIIYGQVALPAGYDINDYLNPTISNIQVN